jgi:hypothetical protein
VEHDDVMRILALLVFFLLPLAAVAQSCNEVCQIGKSEPHFLKRGLAERHGNSLSILAHDKTLVFTNNRTACYVSDATSDAKRCVSYVLIANVPRSHSLVVEKFSGLEGGDSYLVDTITGRQTMISGMPVFSPDGEELLITRMSNEGDNNLEIWRREGDTAKMEWAHPFKQAYAEDPNLREMYETRVTGWSGNHISLALDSSDRKHHWSGSMTRDAGGWHLSAKSPPGLLP